VLAAGASSRFAPRHKLLVPWRGEALVYHSVKAALDARRVTSVYLVLGCCAEQVGAALGTLKDHPKLRLVHNPDWAAGRTASLRSGLAALPQNAQGVLAYPADMPCMSASLIDDVVAGFTRARKVTFPVYNRQKGHPVAFPRAWFGPLGALQDDQSAYTLIQTAWDEATKLERTDACTQRNVNSQQDYERLFKY